MVINEGKEALIWLINNPLKRLYDQYGNYYILASTGNYIEFHHYEIDIDEDGTNNSFWDYDLINFSDFLDNKLLNLETA